MIKAIDYFSDCHIGSYDDADDSVKSREIIYDILRDDENGTIQKKGIGDIFEGWQYSWREIFDCKRNEQLLELLIDKVEFLPGNHDDGLSKLGRLFKVRNTPYYVENDDVLITHGHMFDKKKSIFSWARYVVKAVRFLENKVHPDIDHTLDGWLTKLGRISKRNEVITPASKDYKGTGEEYINGLVKLAKQVGVTKAVFGHTHLPEVVCVDGITIFNIGRNQNGHGSFVRYYVKDKALELKVLA